MNEPVRAEGNDIIRVRTRKNTRRIVVRVAIRPGAGVLELLRIIRRLTRGRISEIAPATILIRIENIAGAPARHRLAVDPNGELLGAVFSQISVAAGDAAVSLAVDRRDDDGEVEAVDEADVVEIQGGEGEFGEGGGGIAGGGAVEEGAAAAALAGAVAGLVEVAAGAAPDAAGPADGGVEDDGLAGLEGEAAAVEVLAGGDPGPDRGLAIVHQGEGPGRL